MYDSNDKFTMQPGSITILIRPQCIGCINNKPTVDVGCAIFGEKPLEYVRNKKRCPYHEDDTELRKLLGDAADEIFGKPPEE